MTQENQMQTTVEEIAELLSDVLTKEQIAILIAANPTPRENNEHQLNDRQIELSYMLHDMLVYINPEANEIAENNK